MTESQKKARKAQSEYLLTQKWHNTLPTTFLQYKLIDNVTGLEGFHEYDPKLLTAIELTQSRSLEIKEAPLSEVDVSLFLVEENCNIDPADQIFLETL